MNLIDLAAVVLLVAGVIGGIRSGALPQLGGLLGAIGGGAVALAIATVARSDIEAIAGPSRPILVIVGLLLLVLLGELVGSTLGGSLSASLGGGVLGTLDRAAGGLIGIAQAVLIVWLVGSLLAIGPVGSMAEQAQRSIAVRITTAALPPVSEVAADLGSLIDASGLPQVFVGLEPFPAPPVDTPAAQQARAIAAAAIPSTAEIASEACSYELTGTGFVVGRGYVVTNAHVVAGSTRTTISLDGKTVRATVVLFDPELDVALLWANALRAAPLRFATAVPPRGTEAAALGHPGGGPLMVIAAGVSGSYTAEGRDLYGTTVVRRDIVELRAAIERGDSGGPLVLPDGTVGGVIFAEARSDPSVGYALSPTEVATTIAPAIGRTAAVSTGPCIR